MSSNAEQMLKIAIQLGRIEGKGHADYIRFLRSTLKTIHNGDLSATKRRQAIHELGLADNKIDSVAEIDDLSEELSREIKNQRIFLEDNQWENLRDCNDRIDSIIEKICRKISPSNMDVREKDEKDSTVKRNNVEDLAT